MNEIIEPIKNQVLEICKTYKNRTGDDFLNHIMTVVTISEQLAEKSGADKEITVLGAYLHDISVPAEFGNLDEHHLFGAELAEKMLKEYDYPTERIERVKKCVLHHRGSKMITKETLEEECVADADAISHFYNIPGLFHVAYGLKLLSKEDGMVWVRKKLDNDFHKLSQRSKDLYQNRYSLLIKTIFDNKVV